MLKAERETLLVNESHDPFLIETWLDSEGFYRVAIHHGCPGFEFEDVKEFLNVNYPTRKGAIVNAKIWWEGAEEVSCVENRPRTDA